MEELLQVGVISSTHGIKGEVKVFPTTDDVNRYKKLKEVWLDTGKEKMLLHPESVKFFKHFVIVKFKEFSSINEIEAYKGKSLYVDRQNAVRLRKDEYFIADLIGLTVLTDEGETFGVMKDVQIHEDVSPTLPVMDHVNKTFFKTLNATPVYQVIHMTKIHQFIFEQKLIV